MKKLGTKGFSPLHILLLVVVVGLIVGTGYYVYSSQQKANTALDNAANSQTDPQKTENKAEEKPAEKVATTGWLEYKAPAFSLRLADGWKVMKKDGNNGSLFSSTNEDLKPQQGTKAIVQDYVLSGQGEGGSGLVIDYVQNSIHKCKTIEEYKLLFTTDSGLEVYGNSATGGGGYRVASDKSYTYCIQLSEEYNLSVLYSYDTKKETDYSGTVSQVVKTVKVN